MAILLYKWLMILGLLQPAQDSGVTNTLKGDTHPLYVSVTEINHNAGTRGLEVSCKIFTDDFEKGISDVFHKKVDLAAPVNQEEANQLVAGYVKKHLVIRIDGKPFALEFVGYERERDAIWSYFEVHGVKQVPKKIEATNILLHETYKTQINLMHVTVSGIRRSTKLDCPESEAKFEF